MWSPYPAAPSSIRVCFWWSAAALYPDLCSRDYESAVALVHSRFSTNTNPSWERAHPNRLIAHNGEINTIRGNADRMLAREETMSSKLLEPDMEKVLPVVNVAGSDSAMLDNTLEFMMMAGMDLPLAVMVAIPEPWNGDKTISRAKRDLYQYYATLMEPWDGPASILFSDGDVVGAVLDRNGLRPSRYYITSDGQLILSSEVGVLELPPDKIIKKSRLEPSKILLVDTREGRIIGDDELKARYASRQPYGEWLDGQSCSICPTCRFPTTGWRYAPRSSAPACRRPLAIPMRTCAPPFSPWHALGPSQPQPWESTSPWPCWTIRNSLCSTTSSSSLHR